MPWRNTFHNFSRHHSLPKELRHFFFGVFLYRFGSGLISLAGPIFLFTIGQEFPLLDSLHLDPVSKGLFFLLAYYLVERVILLLTTVPTVKIIPRIGFHSSIALGVFLLGSRVFLYDYFLRFPILLLVSLILSALGVQFFWLGYHTFFTTEVKMNKLGSEVGGIEFLTRLAQVMAPLIGALIAGNFGFVTAFWTGAVFYGIAVLLMLTLPKLYSKIQWKPSDFITWLRDKDLRKTALAIAAFTWEELGVLVFWPIFLFITFGKITSVGYILSTASFISLLFIYLSGWVFDHKKNKSTLIQKGAGVMLGFLWIPRLLFASSPIALVINDAVDRLTASIYNTLFYASLLFRARGKNVFLFYVNRQIAISLLWVTLLSLSIVLLFFQWNWTAFFVSFMFAALISLMFSKEKRKKV